MLKQNKEEISLGVLKGCIDKANYNTFSTYFVELSKSAHAISNYTYTLSVEGETKKYTFLLHAVDKIRTCKDATEKENLLKIVNFLVREKKINPEVGTLKELSCFQMACIYNLPEVVQILIADERVDLDKKTTFGNSLNMVNMALVGGSSLNIALAGSSYEVAKIILASERKVNVDDQMQVTEMTPLMFAVMHRHRQVELAKTLLERGANPFLSTVKLGVECAYSFLLTADMIFYEQLVDSFHASISDNKNKIKFQKNLTDELLEKLIALAWESKKLKSLEFLLKIYSKRNNNVDDLRVGDGVTYLLLGMKEEFYEGVKVLLKFNVDPIKSCYTKEDKGFPWTPLLLAVDQNKKELVKEMLGKITKEIPIINSGKFRLTLLQYALFRNTDPSIIEALLKKGIDPNFNESEVFTCATGVMFFKPELLPLFVEYGLKLNLTQIEVHKARLASFKEQNSLHDRIALKEAVLSCLQDLQEFKGNPIEKINLMLIALEYFLYLSKAELIEVVSQKPLLCELYCLTEFLAMEDQKGKLGNHLQAILTETTPVDSTQLNYSARKYLRENNIRTEAELSEMQNIANQIKNFPKVSEQIQESVFPTLTWGDGLISTEHDDVIVEIRKTVNGLFYLAVDTMLMAAHSKEKQKMELDLMGLSKSLPVADGTSLRHLETNVARTIEVNGKLYHNCKAIYEYRTQGKARVICYNIPADQNPGKFLTIGAEYLPEGLHDRDDIKSFQNKSEDKPIKIIYKSKYLSAESNVNLVSVSKSPESAEVKTSTAHFVKTMSTSTLPEVHQAAAIGNIPLLTKLLDKNEENINLPSPSTQATPIFNAIKEGHLETVKFLLLRGARVDVQTRSGNTVLDICNTQTQKNKQVIFDLLRQYGAKTKEELKDLHQKEELEPAHLTLTPGS